MKSPAERAKLAHERAERKKNERNRKKAGRERHKLLLAKKQAEATVKEVSAGKETDDVEASRKLWLSGYAVQYPLP